MSAARDPLERFHDSYTIDPDTQCWVWDLALNHHGYGVYKANGKTVIAHRWGYIQLVGEIPDGLVLDHRCRNRACVSPDHLEPMTIRENILAEGSLCLAKRCAEAVLCVHGHPLSGENLYVRPNGNRACRACQRLSNQMTKARKRGQDAVDRLTARRLQAQIDTEKVIFGSSPTERGLKRGIPAEILEVRRLTRMASQPTQRAS